MAPGSELLGRQATSDVADQGRAQHDQREWHIERKDRGKRRSSNHPKPIVFQRPRADPMCRLHDDGCHGGLDPIEETGHHGHFTEGDVHPRQCNQNE
ncbi:hypothetical protein D3C76_1543180 [compost metagenome]